DDVAAFEQEIVHGGLPGDLGSLSVRRGRAAALFGDRRVARSDRGRANHRHPRTDLDLAALGAHSVGVLVHRVILTCGASSGVAVRGTNSPGQMAPRGRSA